ncbi:flagellar hook assembly protein FlgD [Desulfoscipio geothermicus]|jgi:flagellar basal-body rod modification protein FlgD|uniref:Basal-body rod modification protein FlgD n=1 Tax=Desulfoscipio geothermicus DSM 3669 TaxID=1121426 RepID=A0A1I6CV96_9FIRM|nr:flagellar hook capping FlgD N-terminal domain-containing protein [Desulfoscipio geothermicus]SFQ97047.1 flagellar basal-body rod modification protein FlgD [Desulfoscipio geothermicus DSM 3669]
MTEAIIPSQNYYLPDDNTGKKESKSITDPDMFIKILVSQMKYQNPMQPQDSETFVTQLTQMAMMEQMYNVSQSMDNLASKYEMSRYYELIGRQVTLVNGDDVVEGKVGGVVFDEGKPYFYLAGSTNGERYTLDQITGINGSVTNEMLPYFSLVDRQVTVKHDGYEITGVVEKVLLQNGGAALQVDGEVYGVEQIVGVSLAPEDTEPVP